MWCSSDLAGTAQNASICAAKASQSILASVKVSWLRMERFPDGHTIALMRA